MSLEEIRKSIDREAKLRADSIREEGEAEAAAILKAARLSAAELLKAAEAGADKEAERIGREQASGAQMEASSMLVAAKEEVLERHMEQLKKGIAAQLSANRLDKVLAGAAKQFARFSPKGEMVVRTGKKNAALVRKLGYDAVAGEEGQLSVESRDGGISIDASPEGLAEMSAPEARTLLAARLWKVKG
jgi:V/A-type H+-transporting ATPase subunit E